jgi:Tol biopolymer transport system component
MKHPRLFISLTFLLFSLSALSCVHRSSPPDYEILKSYKPSSCWEEVARNVQVSPDGKMAVFYYGSDFQQKIVDLQSGQVIQTKLLEALDELWYARFYHDSRLALLGRRGDEEGWYLEEPDGIMLSSLPSDARPYWSPDGTHIAYVQGRERTLFAGQVGKMVEIQLGGDLIGLAWAPDYRIIYVMMHSDEGSASIIRIDIESRKIEAVRDNLDTIKGMSPIALSTNGRFLYMALAGMQPPDPELKHKPGNLRDLDIYELDLDTEQLRPLVQEGGDDFNPIVAGEYLFWTHNDLRYSVVVTPLSGGEAKTVVEEGMMPYWHPSGGHLSFCYGGWRLVDWALNWDAAMVAVDDNISAVSDATPLVVGYHEDFTPVWSPDGYWIAYHSHRSKKPVLSYSAKGSTDDIYLRRPSAPMEEEMRLTDFGWEVGNPDWSPDGSKLIFTSWERSSGGASGAWMVIIDPSSGKPVSVEKLEVPEGIKNIMEAAWSPTGNKIAVLQGVGGSLKRELWIVDTDMAEAEKLHEFESSTYGGFDWTPDGKEILFSALWQDQMQLFSIPSSGGRSTRITSDYGNLMHPQVSPDGRWVACTRMDQVKELRRLKLR